MTQAQTAIRTELTQLKAQQKSIATQINGLERALTVLDAHKKPVKKQGKIEQGTLDNVLTALARHRRDKNGTLRSTIEAETGINSGVLSVTIKQLEADRKIEQTNKPKTRGTRYALTSQELRLHVGEGQVA